MSTSQGNIWIQILAWLVANTRSVPDALELLSSDIGSEQTCVSQNVVFNECSDRLRTVASQRLEQTGWQAERGWKLWLSKRPRGRHHPWTG